MSTVKVKYFPTVVVLSVCHDKLLCEMTEVYNICNFLTGDELYTHQLPRAQDILKPWIFEQLPQLRDWDDSKINRKNWPKFVELAKKRYGETLPLTPLPPERWTYIDAVEELRAMFGDNKVIVVEPE
jgi:hypothetical protein